MKSNKEFWPAYLRAHSKEGNRVLHAVGTVLGSGLFLGGLVLGSWPWCLGALVLGYGCAWTGHFLVEGNRPATFGHPLWSFYSDYRMLWLMVTGALEAELQNAGMT